MIGRGRSAEWAIQEPSGACKKLLYIYIYVIQNLAKTNLIYFSTKYFGNLEIHNFAQQGLGNEPVAFIIHHYTDAIMAQYDNVGSGTILVLKNAQNAINRPDQPSSYVGTGKYLVLKRENDALGYAEDLMYISNDGEFQFTGVEPITRILNNKTNDSIYSFQIGTNKSNEFPFSIRSGANTLIDFKDNASFTRADIVSNVSKTNGLFLGTGAGEVRIAPEGTITTVFDAFGNLILTGEYRLSALNTAPTSATATGSLGEIRYTEDYIYVCTATNTWKRTPLTTW